MGFPGKQYWSGLLFPFPGDLPDPGIKPMSPAKAGRFYTTEPPGKPSTNFRFYKKLRTCASTDWMNGVQQRRMYSTADNIMESAYCMKYIYFYKVQKNSKSYGNSMVKN